jgi:hypothetical protein
VYFLRQWFNLSDPGAEEALYDSSSMRRFAGIDLGEMPVPDESTVLRFRHSLETHGLGEKLFQQVHAYLEGQGIKIGTGTIVDATIISAPPSTKNKGKSRDPDMHQTKKGNTCGPACSFEREVEPSDEGGRRKKTRRPSRHCVGRTLPDAGTLYRKARAIPRVHLLLLEDPQAFAVRGRDAGFFQNIASHSTSDGPELGEVGVHRKDPRSSQVTQAAAESRSTAGPDVSA